MNAFGIIKTGLENELDDISIIDEIQKEYPTSKIETNIFLIDETKLLLESPPKPIPIETQLNHFLIKSGKNFVDINDGRKFKSFTKLTYSQCRHGLCKKLNTSVLKNVIKKSRTPSIFVAIENKPKENKPIRIKYKNDNKKEQIWEFTSQEINECEKCIDEGFSDKKIAVRIFCPKECVPKLINHIDINQKLERKRNGNIQNKNKPRMDQRRISRKGSRKN